MATYRNILNAETDIIQLSSIKPDLKKRFFLMFIYFWEKDNMNRGGAEGQGDLESEAGSRLRAVSIEPDMGLESMNREIMT